MEYILLNKDLHDMTLTEGKYYVSLIKSTGEVQYAPFIENNKIFYTSSDGNVVTPYASGASVFGANIISNTYSGNKGVITFDADVTSIGNYAFYGCSSLTDIIIPDSVTSIGDWAFHNCSGMITCTIGSGVTSIDIAAFAYCSSLTGITIPDSVTSIGNSAFYYCSSMTTCTIGSGVTSIGNYAFHNCSGMITCTIGSGVTSIGNYAFNYCRSLTGIIIPDSVTSIGDWAFQNCSGMTTCTIGSGVTSIGNYAFYNCSSLSIIISNAVTAPTLYTNSFTNVASVGTLYIPTNSDYSTWKEKLPLGWTISDGSQLTLSTSAFTFESTGGSDTMVVTSNVDWSASTANGYVTLSPYNSISGITNVTVTAPSNSSTTILTDIITIQGNNISATASTTQAAYVPTGQPNDEIWYYSGFDEEILTPYTAGTSIFGANIVSNTYSEGKGIIKFDGDVTKIGNYAFYNCDISYGIDIPNSVTSIGDYAFANSYIEHITIPNSVTSIGDYAFANSYIEHITIPNSVTSIGDYAFQDCESLTGITIPDSVTSIGNDSFNGCSYLSTVTYTSTMSNFNNINKGNNWRGNIGIVHCTDGDLCLTNYISTYFDCIKGEDSISEPSDLIACTITNKCTSIGDYAFSECSELNKITIPNSVTSIGEGAFDSCSSLTGISIPDSVTSIGEGAFDSCSSLTGISIPDSVTSIGEGAFSDCTGMTTCTIGSGVTSIGIYAFDNCNSLTGITIPDSVTSIADWVFKNCTAMTTCTIGSGVTSISNYAFYDDYRLGNNDGGIICNGIRYNEIKYDGTIQDYMEIYLFNGNYKRLIIHDYGE